MPSKARHSQPLAPQWVPNLLIAVAIAAGLVGTTVYYEEIPHFAMKWVGQGERALGLVSLDNFVRSLGTRFPFLNTAFAFYESQHSFLSQDFPLILPTPVLLLTALYVVGAQVLYLVFKHFKLKVSKPVLFLPRALYNFFLVALSTYITSETFYSGVIISKNGMLMNSRDPLPLDIRLARVGWVYYFSKLIEWVDTVLIIISGNFGQFFLSPLVSPCNHLSLRLGCQLDTPPWRCLGGALSQLAGTCRDILLLSSFHLWVQTCLEGLSHLFPDFPVRPDLVPFCHRVIPSRRSWVLQNPPHFDDLPT